MAAVSGGRSPLPLSLFHKQLLWQRWELALSPVLRAGLGGLIQKGGRMWLFFRGLFREVVGNGDFQTQIATAEGRRRRNRRARTL